MTAPEILKAYGLNSNSPYSNGDLVDALIQDKNWDPGVVRRMSYEGGIFGTVIMRAVARYAPSSAASAAALFNDYGKRARPSRRRGIPLYLARPEQNRAIDYALKARSDIKVFAGLGASDFFDALPIVPPSITKASRVAVIGNGVAGLMVTAALAKSGFSAITVFDKSKEFGGIWKRDDVRRSRNNPRNLNFLGNSLPAAPGDGSSVFGLANSLESVVTGLRQKFVVSEVTAVKGTIKGGPPWRIIFGPPLTAHDAEFDIVVNCTGLGPPAPLFDASRMVCTTKLTQAGIRWQKTIPPEEIKRKKFILIGLGNSTGEMLLQLQQARDKGVDCDYRVLTHFSKGAVMNPDETTDTGERVFRDLSLPNLTGYAGDLADLRRAYLIARMENKIIPGVDAWDRDGPNLKYTYRRRRGGKGRYASAETFDHLYTLTGYRWPVGHYHDMGIDTRSDGWPRVAFDGEYCHADGTPKKGYFGLGPMIETPEDRNATVIPGMMHRLHDLVAGVIMRAAETAGF